MKSDEHVDLRGTTLTSNDLRQVLRECPAKRFDFRGCVFKPSGDADDLGVSWKSRRRPPKYGSLEVPVVFDFSEATFEDTADFSGVRFTGPVFFNNTKFRAAVSFDRAHFSGDVWFLDTQFAIGLFTDATFEGRHTGWFNVEAGQLSFAGATFTERAYLEQVKAEYVDFSNASFERRAVMLLAAHCSLDGAKFDEGLELRVFDERLLISMRRTHLGSPSTVASVVSVAHRLSQNGAAPMSPEAELLSLQDTDVTHLGLANIVLSQCLFAGAQNLDKLRIEGETWLPTGGQPAGEPRGLRSRRSSRRVILAEEKLKDALDRKGSGVDVEDWLDWYGRDRARLSAAGAVNWRVHDSVSWERLAVIYRALRKAREDAKDEPGAGDFYYGEMNARRHANTTPQFERWLLTVYWLVSGYGQRAGRAFTVLAVLLVTLTALLLTFGLPASAPAQQLSGLVQPVSGSTNSAQITLEARNPSVQLPPLRDRWTLLRLERATRLATGSVVFRDTDQQLTEAGRWTVNLGRALGPLLLALALLAIRARVKR
ncbi:pentapeptide repeat-containing protein [Lentzea sp. NPDC034063]|uniref:pentapeptide repeat-containing protein n=1 Tax=unclassified Lentzea TaxID=2643253 RepID=UPI0033EDDCB7